MNLTENYENVARCTHFCRRRMPTGLTTLMLFTSCQYRG